MSPYDNSTRIHKKSFLVSTFTLFALCLVSASARFYIRIRVQKSFAIDDGILLFGIGCLIIAMILLATFVEKMYLIGATEYGGLDIQLPADFLEQAYSFEKFAAVSLILTWCSIVSVKFSYLFLFRKLIDRMPPVIKYWWFVAIFNGLISIYGATIYIVDCPYFYSIKALQCAYGKGVQRAINFAISQMVLDIVGDLLILFIPFRLIWTIKIRRMQKIVLSASLCMTILTIICTITRIAGIRVGHTIKSLDSIWEIYWQFIAANVALTMTAATAFRTFFVSRIKDKRALSPASKDSWYTQTKRLLWSAFSLGSRRSQPHADQSGSGGNSDGALELENQIPGGTMTGIRTFINGQGRTKLDSSQIMGSVIEGEYEDSYPLSKHSESTREINVRHEVFLTSEEAC